MRLFLVKREITELLLAECADVDAKNLDGETPLDMAEMIVATSPGLPGFGGDFEETIDLLRKHQLMPCLEYGKDRWPFGFSFNAKDGMTYVVEVTQDFKQWGELEQSREPASRLSSSTQDSRWCRSNETSIGLK